MSFVLIQIAIILTCFKMSSQSSTGDKFQENSVNTDLGLSAPNDKCTVSYGSRDVNLGNILAPSDAKEQPSSISWSTRENVLYSVILVDPDAPSRKNPKKREWRHWVVVNVAGTDVGGGKILTDYNGPTPPKGTGLHRYVFLIFEQRGRINDHLDDDRGGWKVGDFASKHNLNLVAGNFFQVTYILTRMKIYQFRS